MAIAVVSEHVRCTYHRLAMQVLKVMDAMTAAGIQAGQIAGVEATNHRHLHLLILLAAEALDVTTISLVSTELEPPARLDLLCDRVFVTRPVAAADPARVFVMTPEWIADVMMPSENDRPLIALERQPAPDAVVRLIKSSGTTGVPKVMAMTHRVQQRTLRTNLLLAAPRLPPRPDFLCLYNFSIRGAHARALLTLQLGGTIHLVGVNSVWRIILAGVGNYVLFLAGELERFVRTAPPYGGPYDLHIDVIGAAVPPRLRQELREKITPRVAVTYGTNEVHYVSVVDDDGVGTVLPDVRVKIVDVDGKAAAPGQRGLIHVRSDTMTHGYTDAPELTRAAFIDGWYNTNDTGFQPAEGKLVVLGRDDDMLNIGGVKIAPGPLEEQLKAFDGVLDALVTSIDDHKLTGVMLVAVETGPTGGPAGLAQRLGPVIRRHVAQFQLVRLRAFPRTESGKIRREGVKALYREIARGG